MSFFNFFGFGITIFVIASVLLSNGGVAEARAIRLQPGLEITVTPSLLNGTSGMVNVSWTGEKFATRDDWLGLWCPSTVDPYANVPLKYVWLNDVAHDTFEQGYGWANFYLVNIRTKCRFYLVTGGAQYPNILGQSEEIGFVNNNTPTGLHIALPAKYSATATPTKSSSMRVSWASADAKSPVVAYGTDPKVLAYTKADTSSYTASDLCGDVAGGRGWFAPGSLHSAVLTNLLPGQVYYYKVGDESSTLVDSWSELQSFTAPVPPAADSTVHFIAFGDMGNAGLAGTRQHSWDYDDRGEINAVNTTFSILAELEHSATPPSMVVHIGDISYAVGYESEWDQFMEQIRPIASRVPWMTSIGNHEMDTLKTFMPAMDSGGECGIPYASRFRMPAPADTGKADTPWYSFTHGPVFIVQMSTEHDYTTGSVQLKWIEEELASVDRSITPWVIFTGHRPMYIDSSWVSDEPTSDTAVAAALRKYLEPLFHQYKVDLGLWGHHHSYQRTCPVYQTKCTPGATTHAIIGMAGYELSEVNKTPPPYTVYANDKHWGYTRLMVNSSHLHMEFVVNNSGEVLDEIVLQK